MATASLLLDLRIPLASSLKDKRAVIRPILEGTRHRFSVAAGEVGAMDLRQRAELEFAAVSNDPGHLTRILDEVERFVWAHPGVEVLGARRGWVEEDSRA